VFIDFNQIDRVNRSKVEKQNKTGKKTRRKKLNRQKKTFIKTFIIDFHLYRFDYITAMEKLK